jgi:hypothetical protein
MSVGAHGGFCLAWGWVLGGELAVLQAPMLDGFSLDPLTLLDDGWCPTEVDVGGRHVAQALMIALVVVVLAERLELCLKVAGQEVIFQLDAVFQSLVPALDLDLGLRVRRDTPTNGANTPAIEAPCRTKCANELQDLWLASSLFYLWTLRLLQGPQAHAPTCLCQSVRPVRHRFRLRLERPQRWLDNLGWMELSWLPRQLWYFQMGLEASRSQNCLQTGRRRQVLWSSLYLAIALALRGHCACK